MSKQFDAMGSEEDDSEDFAPQGDGVGDKEDDGKQSNTIIQ